jgi:two-component system sensor histidine kinase KdpD
MPAIDADLGMLERVIANVVENALKYAPDSDVVIIGPSGGPAAPAVDGRPCGELRIIDHGQGVPAADVVAMFQPFQRLDDAPEGLGIGLGLAVAKGFIEAMGGAPLAEPTPGGGLTMIVRLPLSTGPQTTGLPRREADSSAS